MQSDIFRSLGEEFLSHAVIHVMCSGYTNISVTYVILCEIILLCFPLNYSLCNWKKVDRNPFFSRAVWAVAASKRVSKTPPVSEWSQFKSRFARKAFHAYHKNLAKNLQARPPFMWPTELHNDCRNNNCPMPQVSSFSNSVFTRVNNLWQVWFRRHLEDRLYLIEWPFQLFTMQ